MLSTAIKIQSVVGDSMTSLEVMESARDFALELCEGDTDKLNRIAELMFQYSATLASVVATNVTHAILTPAEFSAMADSIREMDELAQLIEGENN
jgi:hypothetical protein